jgi:hypothetical protein
MTEAATHPEIERLEAAAFRRLLAHLRQREDATNIELMGLAGFCRNCLADWLAEASVETSHPLTREEARTHVYGEPYADFKARQPEATPEQLARMEESLRRNAAIGAAKGHRLDSQLAESFPASDPPALVRPA